MRKTIYLNDKIEFNGKYHIPVVRFLDGKWREDIWSIQKEILAEFVILRKKEGWRVKNV